jgi:hypothetical protein
LRYPRVHPDKAAPHLDEWFDTPEPPESPETIRIIMKDGKIYKNTL